MACRESTRVLGSRLSARKGSPHKIGADREYPRCPLDITTDRITRTINNPPNCTMARRTPIGPASSRGSRNIRPDTRLRGRPWSTPRTPIGTVRRQLRWDTASPHSDMPTSRPWPTNIGKPGAVHTDRLKKIGSTPRRSCDPALTLADPAPALLESGCWIALDFGD